MTLPRKRSLPNSFTKNEQLSIFSRPRKSWRMSASQLSNGPRNAASTAQTIEQLRGNNAKGGWVVQKFGGTSVGKFASNIAEDIVRFVILERWGRDERMAD